MQIYILLWVSFVLSTRVVADLDSKSFRSRFNPHFDPHFRPEKPSVSFSSTIKTFFVSQTSTSATLAASPPSTTVSSAAGNILPVSVISFPTFSPSLSTVSPTICTTSQLPDSTPVPSASPDDVSIATNGTANTTELRTWWHNTGEINHKTAVQPGNVRQSHLYSIQVRSLDKDTYYDSFVYETIPRNGNGNILVPGKLSSTTTANDGVTIESDINMTMAWAQFLYQSDVSVKIHRLDGFNANASDIVIRPTTLTYNISDSDGDIDITVPYSGNAIQFSVEFADVLYDFHNGCTGPSCGFVQDSAPDGKSYVKSFTNEMPIMATEPLNSLMIFASPFETSDMTPDSTDSSSLVVEPGLVTDLDQTTANTLIFNPGVYYLTGTAHANLSETVDWVYLAPGAYVKGAFQFWSHAENIKATGHGVLSGEQYVYQANPTNGYINDASNAHSLRMWMGYSYFSVNQTFFINGPTTNAPPFNSVDWQGDLDTISIQSSDYKQVGGFFAQTDGMTLYSNTEISDIFYHSNDDTIKTYGSDISVSNIVVWKGTTAPTIQFGWASRNLSNVTISDINIIHSRYNTNGSHPSLIGSNQVYPISESLSNTADIANTISSFSISNIRSEGLSGNLMRICPLSNFKDFTITNVSIEAFALDTTDIFGSQLPAFTDSEGTVVSMEGFVVSGYEVGGVKVADDNFNYTQLGGLNIAPHFIKNDRVVIV